MKEDEMLVQYLILGCCLARRIVMRKYKIIWWSGVIAAESHLMDEVESLLRNKMYTTRLSVVV